MTVTINKQPENHASARKSWHPRPEAAAAIKRIGESIDRCHPEAEITETSVSYSALYGHTTISVSPLEFDTVDGYRLSERFDVRTELSGPLHDFSDEFIAYANVAATTGALIRCADTDKLFIGSGISVFEEDAEALERLYTPTLALAALCQPLAVQQALIRLFGTDLLGDDADVSLPQMDNPSRWQEEEFQRAACLMEAAGVFCNADKDGLTAEYPWDEGAVSAISGGCTSLMIMNNHQTHPTAGNGLHFRLQLPVTVNENESADLVASLNLMELTGVDIPPTFGAWTVDERNGTLTYVGFWPNLMYRPGTVANIASWCRMRSRIARQFLGNRL